MAGLVKAVVTALVPDEIPGEPPHVYRWRQVVALSIVGLGVVMFAFIALAFGIFPAVFPGFASKAELGALAAQQTEIRVSQIENAILDAREKQCRAGIEGNRDALSFARDRITEKTDSYYALTHREYRIPACDELLPVPMPDAVPAPANPRPVR